MWFLAAAAFAASPEPSDSLASQLKRGLYAADFGDVKLERVRLYPEIIRLSESKLALLLKQDEWLAVGVIETKSHGRLRVTCHLTQCVAEAGEVSIELSLVKGADPEPPKKKRPKKARSEAVAEQT